MHKSFWCLEYKRAQNRDYALSARYELLNNKTFSQFSNRMTFKSLRVNPIPAHQLVYATIRALTICTQLYTNL